jgi:hypothetical protein
MNRRQFIVLASGLLVPAPERVRAYSFVGGWTIRIPTNPDCVTDGVTDEVFWLDKLPFETDESYIARHKAGWHVMDPGDKDRPWILSREPFLPALDCLSDDLA